MNTPAHMPDVDPDTLTRLLEGARAAALASYCPYSRFRVGAAVLGNDQRIYQGCNVENASYGLTICAERNAIFHAVAKGCNSILALALYTPTPQATTPCGACRQVIREFGQYAPVHCFCDSSDQLVVSADELLPRSFGPESL